jgi:NitT/TauT family transport system substrate-binding protein
MTTFLGRPARVAVLLALLAVVTGGGGRASAQNQWASTSLTLGLVQGTDFTHAMPSRVAEARGYFKAQKLKVNIVGFTSGSDLVKAMQGGSVDIGAATGLDVATANAHGVHLQAFYGVASKSPVAVISKRSEGIKSLANLRGKKIGISAFGSFTDFTARSIIKEQNFGSSDLTEVPLGAPPTNMAALQTGQVDAILLPIAFTYVLRANGQDVTYIRTSKNLTTPSQFAVLMASPSFLKGRAAAIRRLLKAYSQAIRFMQTKSHRNATVAIAVKQLGLTSPVATQIDTAVVGLFTANGKINTSGLKTYAKALPELGISPTVPGLSQMYTAKFLPVK